MHDLVIRCPEFGMTCKPAEARPIDERLRVLDPEPDRERFCLQEDAAALEHAQRIARAVTQREHDVPAEQGLAALEHRAFELPILDEQIRHLALEAHLAAELDDFRAHLFDNAGEAKRADVRLADEEDFRGRARAHEFMHDLAAVELRILDLAVKLAVGEQARPTLAELNVGFGSQDLLAPQPPGVLRAPSHVPPALEHDGPETHLREQQRGKQTAGPETHDEGSLLERRGRFRHGVIGRVRSRPDLPVSRESFEYRSLVRDLHVDDANEEDAGVLLARVVAAFEERELQ
jgi:hypothetical protein